MNYSNLWLIASFLFVLCLFGTSFRLNKGLVFKKKIIHILCQNNHDVYSFPQSPTSYALKEADRVIKKSLVLWGGILASSRNVKAAVEPDDKVCSDSLTFLNGPRNKPGPVLIIGTAHISVESALLVGKAIRNLKPDVVMIELDPKRIGKLPGNKSLQESGFDIREDSTYTEVRSDLGQGKSNLFSSLRETAQGWAQAAAGAVLGQALRSFYKSIEKLGFTAGGEFSAAVEAGRASGARILLGDRDVDITLQRLSQAISDSDPNSFDRLGTALETLMGQDSDVSSSLSMTSFPTDKETVSSIVEGMKQRAYLSRVMGEVRREVPKVYDALIGERDEYMAESIAGARGRSVVAVVGMAHMDGIERFLLQKGYTLGTAHCV